jgi:hypothetical protein
MWIRGSPSRSTSERLWAKGKREGQEQKGREQREAKGKGAKGSKRKGSKGKQKGSKQRGEAKGAKGREQRAHKRSEVLLETSPRHMPSWTPRLRRHIECQGQGMSHAGEVFGLVLLPLDQREASALP